MSLAYETKLTDCSFIVKYLNWKRLNDYSYTFLRASMNDNPVPDRVGINTEKDRRRTEKDLKARNHILFTEKEVKCS